MKSIDDFLSKFKIIRNPKENREQVILIINRIVGTDITESEVQIEKGIVNIHSHPAIKGLVFMQKDRIVTEVKEKLPDLHISDIR